MILIFKFQASTINKARMEMEYVKPLSFDFVLKKIIEKEERKIIILN